MCSSFYGKFEFFCWHTGWNVWPIIISDNRPIVYRYMFLEVLMNNYKSLKKQLKFCIKTMNDSSSLFVVDSNKDFTRKRNHLFGSTLFNVLLLESGSLKDEMFKLFGYNLDTPTASSFVQARSKIRPDAFHSAIKDSKTTFYKANNSNKPFSAIIWIQAMIYWNVLMMISFFKEMLWWMKMVHSMK